MAQPQALTLDQALEAARELQQAGELETARTVYRRILALAPDNPDALTMLASIGYQLGDDEAAADHVERAIGAYRRLLMRGPGNHGVRAALANLLLARDRVDEAAAVIGRAVVPLRPVRATPDEFAERRRRGRERGLPPILINALPKSASESIWNRLANGLGIAQAHVSIGLFPDCLAVPNRLRDLARGGLAAKEHLPATAFTLASLANAGVDRVVVHLRDPRQSTLSWAYFLEDDVRRRLLAPIWRKTSPRAGFFGEPLAAQLDWHIEHYLPIVMRFIGEWVAAAEANAGVRVLFLDFESFKTDPDAYFDRLLAFHDIDPATFAHDAEAEVVHLRKGAVDEWRAALTAAQRARAWEHMPGPIAERFGWTR